MARPTTMSARAVDADADSASSAKDAHAPARSSAPTTTVRTSHELLAGSASSLLTRLLISPFDVLKIRFQLQNHVQTSVRMRASAATAAASATAVSSAPAQPMYTSVWQAVRTIARTEGWTAFWKGNVAAELMVVPYGAVSFVAYTHCKQFMTRDLPAWAESPSSSSSSSSSSLQRVVASTSSSAHYKHVVSMTSGAFAGCCATLATYPLDLLRTRFAAQHHLRVYPSIASAITSIVRDEGLRGLFVGVVPTLYGIVPLFAIQFVAYESLKSNLEGVHRARARAVLAQGQQQDPRVQLTSFELSACGFIAGLVSKFLTMPFDTIKKRFQVRSFDWQATVVKESRSSSAANVSSPNSSSSPPSSSPAPAHQSPPSPSSSPPQQLPRLTFWRCATHIVQHEGWRSLFKGSVPALLKAGPSSALIYLVYEQSLRLLQHLDADAERT